MTQNTEHTENSVEKLRAWRNEYKSRLVASPLEDISQLVAKVDITHANPSGIAQLFARGSAPLHSLFRDNGMLRAAMRRVERVLEDQAAKKLMSGVAGMSLVVGVATWKGNKMPVLLYPVTIVRDGKPVEHHTTITFTGHVRLNTAFVAAMKEQGVVLDERKLFDGSQYASGSPETASVFAAITKLAREVCTDFSIEPQIVLGCFMDPSSQVLNESQMIIDALAKGNTGNTLLDALAGDEHAREELSDEVMPPYSPFDGDPHAEFEVGDVDNTIRYAANMAADGHSLFVDGAFGEDSAQQAAAIASRCVMHGRSVLYVPCVPEQRRRFLRLMRANELGGQILDIGDQKIAGAIDRQLIDAVGFQQTVATSRFNQLADELVGVRSRLARYLGDLHGVNSTWEVSAYQTIQNLAKISQLPTHPSTRVRLSKDVAVSIKPNLDEWTKKLERAGELGEYTLQPEDTAWFGASIYTEDEAIHAYQRVVDMLRTLLPQTRDQVASTVKVCGFPVPTCAQEWGRQVTVLKNLRRVLDVFQPEIFERDLDAMLEATKSKAQRKAEGSTMGFWERRRLVKEAKSMLRVGARVENLHDALEIVSRQAEQWRLFVPHGGWPVLPPKLDDIVQTQHDLTDAITALDTVLATTPSGANLQTDDLAEVETRLKALFDDKKALDTLPERATLERDFRQAGLSELVQDLRNRHVETDAVGNELRLAWWTTVFEDIVHSSAIISNQDGSVLQTASERFAQVDIEHVRSVGPMIMQESMRRLSDLLFNRTQEANMVHTMLSGPNPVPLTRIHHDHPQILAAAKPVLMATPTTLAAVTNPVPIADVVIIDAASHLPSVLMLSILSRAKQAIVLAHRQTITSEGVRDFVSILPRISVNCEPTRRDQRVNLFLKEHGYGNVPLPVVREGMEGHVHFSCVDGSGMPVMASGLVESSQQEIDEIVRIITERATTFDIVPVGYILCVVTMTNTFRTRLGAELKALAGRDQAMERFLRHVRIVDITDVAGAQASDVILSMSYAKTSHGRLLQQFGVLDSDGGKGMILDALALAQRHVDIVSSFSVDELDDDRLHHEGPRMMKTLLQWAQHLDDTSKLVPTSGSTRNVLFDDLAKRIRERGLRVELDYGFDNGMRIPMVVGLQDKPFVLAILTDDAHFMSVQSTRTRHRILMQQMDSLGWHVMSIWSVAAFVNPEKEVDRIVAQLGEVYRGDE